MTELQEISIETVKGIGPARKKLLARLGINSVSDALRFFPRDYSDRSRIAPISRTEAASPALVVATVVSVSLRRYAPGKSVVSVKVTDGTGELYASWFNQPYLVNRFRKGQRLALFGKVGFGPAGERQMSSPEVEVLPGEETASPHLFRIVPIYPATEDLSQHIIRKTLFSIVERFPLRMAEFLPSATRGRLQLLPLPEAVRNIHFPESWSMLERAKKRIIFQEFFLLQMCAALRRNFINRTKKARPSTSPKREERAERFLSRLPFSLTSAQRRAIEEIRRDLSSPRPMNRLLHGDVGCGKTIVAVWAILWTVARGHQACLMAPTELLARQHYSEVSGLLANQDCTVSLLVGSAAAKETLHSDVSGGRADLVIGTQAVIQEKVHFKRLGLAVIDEQQRFGVLQRLMLFEKGDHPDLLVLSATPIPRTLCQTLYGDMDISVIDEMPPGRLPIKTKCLASSETKRAYELLREIIRSGERAYVVCPTIEEKEASERASAVETCHHFAREVFPEMRVGLLHGSMEPLEKEEAIRKFRSGFLDILVTTTVIEIGIDIPDAGAILITNGECFGLAQLHQMRGRVGRGGRQGYCIVVADPRTDAARERLGIFEHTSDGFEIAREDLRLRGVGEFFGIRQHGLPEVGACDIFEHQELMRLAREEAFSIVNGETSLPPHEKEILEREVAKLYGDRLRLGFV